MPKKKIKQTGTGNIALSGIKNSEITVIIGVSHEYNELLEKLETQEKLLSLTPENDTIERQKISKKIEAIKITIEEFKRDVIKLAEQFQRAEIESPQVINVRLNNAKRLFLEGKFRDARAVFDTERDQMRDEKSRLLVKRDEYKTDILPRLKNLANEYFIHALLAQLDYSNKNWFKEARQHFEDSIETYPTKYNVFEYAYFLWRHNHVKDSEKYWQQFLTDFAAEISLPEKARALNNLGLLQWDSNEYQRGLDYCEEAYGIYTILLKDGPSIYLSERAGTLNNIAMFHGELGEHSKAEKEYEEVLRTYSKLNEDTPSDHRLFEIGKISGNLGSIYTDTKKYRKALAALKKSLAIYKQVTGKFDVLFYVATSLHNLGRLHHIQKKYKESIEAYETALEIRMKLAEYNPMVYIPEGACTLSNLAYIYTQVPDKEKSIEYALKTLLVLLPIYEQVPFTQGYMRNALNVLNGWGLSHDEIDQMLAEAATAE
ncbi:MAG TPA: tetratricopeptide repeat protein [Blastocatellia bacterium]|nr:tetratricopeptide repeat protein [Blastocatellia bacterium]